jgi:hypothetical protein
LPRIFGQTATVCTPAFLGIHFESEESTFSDEQLVFAVARGRHAALLTQAFAAAGCDAGAQLHGTCGGADEFRLQLGRT